MGVSSTEIGVQCQSRKPPFGSSPLEDFFSHLRLEAVSKGDYKERLTGGGNPHDGRMQYLAIAGLSLAPLFAGFLMEPWLPLGHWGWAVLLSFTLLPSVIYWRLWKSFPRLFTRPLRKFLGKGRQRKCGELGTVTVAGREGSGRAIPTHRSNFWKWLWYRATGTSGKRRLQNVADLQRCLDELIKYSGFPVTEKVTSGQIEASNALLLHLQRASAILDEQAESHPKIEKGLTVINHTEWIEFLSKRLAQADAR